MSPEENLVGRIRRLRDSKIIDPATVRTFPLSDCGEEQFYAVLAILEDRLAYPDLESLKFKFPTQWEDLAPLLLCRSDKQSSKSLHLGLIADVVEGRDLGPRLRTLVQEFVAHKIPPKVMAYLLMKICLHGMSLADTQILTDSIVDSGAVFDYRNHKELNNRKIIRRYPTGGLSEKVALILPSMISAVATQYHVASPFLVARSLGFTGGTWDKLSSIPGFAFPRPGEETLATLKRCGVAMTVPIEDICPADRFLYQLRSCTGTVESVPLAAASIASKQLAVPADIFFLDVRYGPGAFFEENDARELASWIERLLKGEKTTVEVSFIEMKQPTGTSIGNVMELAEAMHILGAPSMINWDKRALQEQIEIVADFYAGILVNMVGRSRSELEMEAKMILSNRRGLEGLRCLLLGHGVEEDLIEKITTSDILDVLGVKRLGQQIEAKTNGRLKSIDQKRLGDYVNFDLGAGGNKYFGHFDPWVGIVLKKRLDDDLQKGDVLCEVYAADLVRAEGILKRLSGHIRDCFIIE